MRWAAVAAGLSFMATSAHGMNLPEYDLASLVLLSDFVVLVDQFEKETMPAGSKVPWCRVTKVYKGAVLAGAEFPRPELNSVAMAKWDEVAVVFLVKKIGRKDQWDPIAIEVVLSGIRLLRNGRVYRLRQLQNPGPYVLTPDKRPQDGSEVRFADLEKGLEAAMLRVASLEWALSSQDKKKRREALLELLGPPLERPVFAYENFLDYLSDVFTGKVLEGLGVSSNLDIALEGFARCRSYEYRSLSGNHWKFDFLDAACDVSRSVPQRATALWMLQGPFRTPQVSQYQKLAVLLKATEPEIRRSAAGVIDRILSGHGIDERKENEERRTILEALAAAWKVEADPLTRTVLFSAGNLDFFVQAASPDSKHPIQIEGSVSDGTAHYVYAFGDGHDRVASDTFVVAVPAQGGSERRSRPLGRDEGVRADGRPETLTPEQLRRRRESRARSFYIDTGFKRVASSYIEFDPPLLPGKYKMWIEGRYSTKGDSTLPQDSPELVLTTRPCEVTIQPEPSNPEKPK